MGTTTDPGPCNGATCSIDIDEIRGVLAPLSLTSVKFGKYLLIMRTELDVMIAGEPYLALALWFDLNTGHFVTRIWNQSVSRGSAVKVEQLAEACESHFMSGKPCIGVPQVNDDLSEEFLISQTPIPRQISRACQRTLGRGAGSHVNVCPECLKLREIDLTDAEVKCKVETLSNGDEASDTEHTGALGVKYKEEDYDDKPDPEDLVVTYDYPQWESRETRVKKRRARADLDDESGHKVKRTRMKCPYCTMRQFPSTSSLENHMKTKHFWGNFLCPSPQCDLQAEFARDLIDHVESCRNIEDGNIKIDCPQCNNRFPADQLKKHYQECVAKEVPVCPWCKKVFDNTNHDKFLRHKKRKHFWGIFNCSMCSFTTNLAKNLVDHVKTEEQEENALVKCPECTENFPILELESHYKGCVFQSLKCPYCDKKFKQSGPKSNESGRNQHMRMVHFWGIFRCIQCNYRVNFAKDLIEHMQEESHDEDPSAKCPNCDTICPMMDIGSHYEECLMNTNTKCQWCNKRFGGMSGGMDNHRKKVHFWGVFRCPMLECQIKVNFAQELIDHMLLEQHMADPNVNCPRCTNKYPIAEIVSHYQVCVTGDTKVKQCRNCKKRFPKEEFLLHQKICVGEPETKKEFPVENANFKLSKASTDTKPQARLNSDSNEVEIQDKEPSSNRVQCPVCGIVLSKGKAISDHKKREHLMGKWYCPKCPKLENYAQDLLKHMVEQQHDTDPFVKCPECSEKFPMEVIETHYKECLRMKSEAAGNVIRVCEHCGKSLKAKQYNSHLRIHRTQELKLLRTTNDDLWHYCDKCGKRFASKQGMANHVRIEHDGEKEPPAKCPICLLEFKDGRTMRRHKVIEHDKKFQCKHCGHCCGNRNDLVIHLTKHEEPKFQCSYCEKKMKTKQKLTEHERLHTGEKPFPCPMCSAAFASKSSLNQHRRGVHKIAPRGGRTDWYRKEKPRQ